jgi:hypothetical protein
VFNILQDYEAKARNQNFWKRAPLDLLPSDVDKREQSPSMEASVGGIMSNPSCKGHRGI